jgi:hypothetical protein
MGVPSAERRAGLERRRSDRRRGRPADICGENPSQVGTRLSADLHDLLIQVAAKRGETVSEVLRGLVEQLRDSVSQNSRTS